MNSGKYVGAVVAVGAGGGVGIGALVRDIGVGVSVGIGVGLVWVLPGAGVVYRVRTGMPTAARSKVVRLSAKGVR